MTARSTRWCSIRLGERLASASEDRSARLWEAASGRLIEKMPHTDSVRAVAFSPSGDRVASAGNDFTARVWDGRTGAPIPDLVLRGHTQFVFALAFSPSGDRLVTSAGINQTGDPAIRLWDIAPRPAHTLTGHGEPVRRAAFSPDGTPDHERRPRRARALLGRRRHARDCGHGLHPSRRRGLQRGLRCRRHARGDGLAGSHRAHLGSGDAPERGAAHAGAARDLRGLRSLRPARGDHVGHQRAGVRRRHRPAARRRAAALQGGVLRRVQPIGRL